MSQLGGISTEYRKCSEFLVHFFVEFLKTNWSSQSDVLFFDLARSTRRSYKSLSFNYKNQSQSFRVNLEEDITNFLRVVKGHFQINDEIAIGFRLASTETIIVIMRTEDFWLLSADALPEYDIIAREKKGESPELLLSHKHESGVSRFRPSRTSDVDPKNLRSDSAFPGGSDVCAKESDKVDSKQSPCLVSKIWRGSCWFSLIIARSISFVLVVSSRLCFISFILSLLTSFASNFVSADFLPSVLYSSTMWCELSLWVNDTLCTEGEMNCTETNAFVKKKMSCMLERSERVSLRYTRWLLYSKTNTFSLWNLPWPSVSHSNQ